MDVALNSVLVDNRIIACHFVLVDIFRLHLLHMQIIQRSLSGSATKTLSVSWSKASSMLRALWFVPSTFSKAQNVASLLMPCVLPSLVLMLGSIAFLARLRILRTESFSLIIALPSRLTSSSFSGLSRYLLEKLKSRCTA